MENVQQIENEEITAVVADRDRLIVRTSIIGIITNVFLAAFKAAIGLLSHSIAVVLDAVNNLSDALSSLITIIGTKLSAKLPDKKHPLGYGRIEYLTALVVAAIVLYAGATSLVESVKKIIHPETADYSLVSLVIIAVAVVVKLLLGRYVKAQGKKANSAALEASGADASFDAVLSASVLLSAIIFLFFGVSLEAWVGVVISCFIIKSGIEMITETLDDILGKRADAELTGRIRASALEEDEVRGVYDIIVNNYGPNKNTCSLHVELPDVMTVDQVDVLTRRIQARVYKATGVIVTGVGVYAYNTKDDEAAAVRNRVMNLVLSHDWALQLHGFHADTAAKTLRFDVVMSFDITPEEGLATLYSEVQSAFPNYTIHIVPDVDAAD
ncbi:MAG: cation diffusion facilitator family transporter [Eubacteriales bacterium]|nr:cation diffusion facilitator family transporter [Eubacteriales bacterium]